MDISKKIWWMGGGSITEENELPWVDSYDAYTPTYTGFSVVPTVTAYYKNFGGLVHLIIVPTSWGTSNGTGFTMTLPIATVNAGTSQRSGLSSHIDGGGVITSQGMIVCANNSITATLYSAMGGTGAWSGAGSKSATMGFMYEASGGTIWVPVFTGFSVSPTVVARYYNYTDKFCHVWVTATAHGTSNGTGFTFTLPFTSANNGITQYISGISVTDNGTGQTTAGFILIPPNSNVATVYRTGALGAWTGSGNKSWSGSFQYEIN